MKKSASFLGFDVLISLVSALLIGAGISTFQPDPYLVSWLSTGILLWLSFFLGLRTWRLFKGGRTLAILLLVTFFVRVLLGVFLHQALPVIGFDTKVQNAGYVYSDAYSRDTQAFSIASTPGSLFTAFTSIGNSDQYGGLLFLSALVYRVLSPDTARPLLITVLGALAMTLGLAFLYDGVRQRWGKRAALVAGWFLALYPEGVLLGSSQMREPFLIGLFCLGVWAVLTWHNKKGSRTVVFLISMVCAVLVSIPVGLLFTAALLVFVLVEWLSVQTTRRSKLLGWGSLILFSVLILFAGWKWLQPTLYYDAYLTQSSSGLIAMLIKQIGRKWIIPFVTVYGLAQPVLPAALTDVSLPVWMGLSIWRGLGWYIAIPFLIYGAVTLWRAKPRTDKWLMLFLLVAILLWTVVSSARAGGDQWDNPRYRAVFLPLLSILVGWLAVYSEERHGTWLKRIFLVVFVDVALFTLWYMPRRGVWGIPMSFVSIVFTVIVVSIVSVLGFGLYDFLNRSKKQPG